MSDAIGDAAVGDHAAGTGGDGTGRYLYCLVHLGDESVDRSPTLDVAGIEGESVSVVVGDERAVGAVVHPRDGPYDTTDLATLRDWLLAHQRVVEAAGDRFGTPFPVRFDTVLDGGDATVGAWLDRNADAIADAFESIGGRWEYRATLSWDPSAFEREQCATDAELADLERRLERADAGKRFLLEKKREERLRELVRRRRETLVGEFVDRLEEAGDRLVERPVESDAAASLGVEMASDAVAQVALLAVRDRESAIGEILESVAEEPGVDVRFTGPWPPYTFAPEIGDE